MVFSDPDVMILVCLSVLSAVFLLTAVNTFLIFRQRKYASSGSFSKDMAALRNEIERDHLRIETSLRGELSCSRSELNKETREQMAFIRQSMNESLRMLGETQEMRLESFETKQNALNAETLDRMERIRATMENKMAEIRTINDMKLSEMKTIVDEKLQESVERRFSESFKGISDRLDLVHKGLGEMQTLANDVGGLKKALTNVKIRGTIGEVQLGAILEQFLAPDQYEKNAAPVKNSSNRVEFAIRLPGKDNGSPILLPIDSKFPIEDYQRLADAVEQNDMKAADAASARLENAVRKNAKDIFEKYICPPETTDFGIMFVPTEGLYAEILRRPGLVEQLQRDYHVTVVGPINLAAFLNSLYMGFRTLAVEKRSGEVWTLLSGVKKEFELFGAVLEKTQKKLNEASSTLNSVDVRTRAINKKLRDVETLPAPENREADTLFLREIDDTDDDDAPSQKEKRKVGGFSGEIEFI